MSFVGTSSRRDCSFFWESGVRIAGRVVRLWVFPSRDPFGTSVWRVGVWIPPLGVSFWVSLRVSRISVIMSAIWMCMGRTFPVWVFRVMFMIRVVLTGVVRFFGLMREFVVMSARWAFSGSSWTSRRRCWDCLRIVHGFASPKAFFFRS